jgi:ABC-type ATPase involved in cell division
MRLLRRFSDVGVTVLVATHDQHIVRELAKREIVLASGEVHSEVTDTLPHLVASK